MISSLGLKNIQSWKDTKLNPAKLNVIIARNETGKSVPIKVLRYLVFGGSISDTEEILRRHEDKGQLTIQKGDINLAVDISKGGSSYTLTNSKTGQILDSIISPLMPDKIIEFLGLQVDYKEKIILNIIDQEMGQPFINTSPSFNYKTLEFYTNSKILAQVTENSKALIANLVQKKKDADLVVKVLGSKIAGLELMDVSKLAFKQAKMERMQETVLAVDKLKALMEDFNVIEFEENNFKCMDREINTLKILNKIIKETNELKSMQPPERVEFVDMSNVLNQLKLIEKLILSFKELDQLTNSYTLLNHNAAKDLEDFISKVKICPTCGRIMGGSI